MTKSLFDMLNLEKMGPYECKKDTIFGAARKNFDPSYFVTALAKNRSPFSDRFC